MKVIWQSPSNIALIKYWGKHDKQLPNNPSLSLTLSKANTTTSLALEKKSSKKKIDLAFTFEGKENRKFSEKIETYLSSLATDFPWLEGHRLLVNSENSFPHSAGIASSASAMSALAVCLLSMDSKLKKKKNRSDFFELASFYARLGSGSAARSVYGKFSVWGKTKEIKNSSNKFAVPFPVKFHRSFENLQDTILIVHDGEKNVSSSAGHALMRHHPMEKQRYRNANNRLKEILSAFKKGDWESFCIINESEALELHALMMTSNPSYILMKPETLALIEKIQTFRKKTKIPISFTLDAGPNVHLLYPDSEKKKVQYFISNELLPFCADGKVIYDEMGNGPKQIS